MVWMKSTARLLLNKRKPVTHKAAEFIGNCLVCFSCAASLFAQEIAFPDLQGPSEVTILPTTPERTLPEAFSDGSSDALGIFVADESASWLGLVHGLRSIGVPVRVVTDIEQAFEHDVLVYYPMLTGSSVEPEILRRLAEHVRSGKTLIAFSVIGGGMPGLFGFESTIEHRSRQAIRFQNTPLTERFIFEPEEAAIRLAPLTGAGNSAGVGMPGVSYGNPRRPPIALFADGNAAITQNFFSTNSDAMGYAYAVGIDLGHFILRAHNGRFSGYALEYVNAYQPSVDSFLRFFAEVYRQGEPDAVLLSPVPYGKDLAVLLTHDIDFTESLENSLEYAESEAQLSVPATYFVQTKYVRDYNDDPFFDQPHFNLLQQLSATGVEIGSHSVAHSNEFRFMPIGTGEESYPEYQPFVQDFTSVLNASVLGELRVSRYLLEQTTGQQVRAFRPGHLSLPERLPEMLQATGYEFSSSITANEALTHLPYRLMHSRGYDAETSIYEFPVTFEDEQWALQDSLTEVLSVSRKIGRHGGLVNLLIHTESTADKIPFQEAFVNELRDEAFFTTVNDFGDWWGARDTLEISVLEQRGETRELLINPEDEISGLTLQLPDAWIYNGGLPGSEQVGNKLILGRVAEPTTLLFSIDESSTRSRE